jgi:hypothetical protein
VTTVEAVAGVFERRDTIGGLEMTYEPKYLRFFQARFRRLSVRREGRRASPENLARHTRPGKALGPDSARAERRRVTIRQWRSLSAPERRDGRSAGAFELQRYLSDQIAPLMVVEAADLLVRHAPS